MAGGATIVIVSHSLSIIQTLCSRAILLNHGEILKNGPTDEVLPFYENIVIHEREKDLSKKMNTDPNRVSINTGGSLLDVTAVSAVDSGGHARDYFYPDDEIALIIRFDAKQKLENPTFWVDILRSDGVICCSCISSEEDFFLEEVKGPGAVKLSLGKLRLTPNIYLLKITVMDREFIHSYAVRYQDVLKIGAEEPTLSEDTIFMPQVKWEKI